MALLLLLSCYHLGFSQASGGEKDVQVRYINLDVVNEQEIRITKINYLGVNHVLQLFYGGDGRWHYRLAAEMNSGFIICAEDTIAVDGERIQDDFSLLKSIPNQRDIALEHQDGTEMDEEKVAFFFETVIDGSAYKVEFWNDELHGELRYDNPDVYVEILRKQKYSTVEHERFNEFVSFYEEIYGPLSGYGRLVDLLKNKR